MSEPYGLTLVTAAAALPITAAYAKRHMQAIGSDVDDTYAEELIAVAAEWLQDITARAFINQIWRFTTNQFPYYVGNKVIPYDWRKSAIILPLAPVSEIVSFEYRNTDDATYDTLASSEYVAAFNYLPPRLYPVRGKVWPIADPLTPEGVKIEFVAGYGIADLDVPYTAKHAIAQLVAHMYANREPFLPEKLEALPMGLQALVNKLKYRSFVS